MPKPDSVLLKALHDKLAQPDPTRDRLPSQVNVFCVGGAVRDAILGEPSTDLDFVVVGARVDDMIAAGFTPVGKDFPVFLHPQSHDEYALARTERKSGKGYKGFVFNADPGVSLEDDLSRRDLTINAIAMDREGGLIDPHGGQSDLAANVLRHIGDAFAEDPVRLLRLARFAARWPQFTIADSTMALCRKMVGSNEADALVPERVWQEISKGLMEARPSRMIDVLAACGAWMRLHPQAAPIDARTLAALDRAAAQDLALEGRYALLVLNAGNGAQPSHLFKASADCIEMAELLQRQLTRLPDALQSLASNHQDHRAPLLDWLLSSDVTRRMQRYETLLACLLIRGEITAIEHQKLRQLAAMLTSESAAKRAAQAAEKAQSSKAPVPQAVYAARLALLNEAIAQLG